MNTEELRDFLRSMISLGSGIPQGKIIRVESIDADSRNPPYPEPPYATFMLLAGMTCGTASTSFSDELSGITENVRQRRRDTFQVQIIGAGSHNLARNAMTFLSSNTAITRASTNGIQLHKPTNARDLSGVTASFIGNRSIMEERAAFEVDLGYNHDARYTDIGSFESLELEFSGDGESSAVTITARRE